MSYVILAVAIFLLVYALIVTEKVHRTVAALLGASLLLATRVISQDQALRAIDFNTLGLLAGMMIVVAIARRTGVFEYVAIYAVRWSRGNPWLLLVSLSVVTAVISAFLDNVTTVLLVAPLTIDAALSLRLDPRMFLLAEVFASNVGGTATLIGDPPNIMIGSAVGLTFNDFIINDTPAIILAFIAMLIVFRLIFRVELAAAGQAGVVANLAEMDPAKAIRDPVLLRKSLVVIGLVLLGFFTHGLTGLETASIAMIGASLLLFVGRVRVEEVLDEIEWPTLFFFLGLFIVVGALKYTGVLAAVASVIGQVTAGHPLGATMVILWVSAILSAFIDNIPFVATMIPIIGDLQHAGGVPGDVLWWALSLGACLGGNGTLIGASANVVVAGMAGERGFNIDFKGFLRAGMPVMLATVLVSAIYLYVRYFLLRW